MRVDAQVEAVLRRRGRLTLAVVIVAAATGCGRFGFGSQLADATGDASGDDAATGDAGSGEPCNGIDDNGNGLVDEGCPCTPFTMNYPTENFSGLPISTGSDWIVNAGDHYDRIDGTTGALVASFPADANDVITAWNGSALVGFDAGAVKFLALDGTVVATGPATGVSSSRYPTLPLERRRLIDVATAIVDGGARCRDADVALTRTDATLAR